MTEAELAASTPRASVFAFLSEYEGFGLTPLEALAVGRAACRRSTRPSRARCTATRRRTCRPGDRRGRGRGASHAVSGRSGARRISSRRAVASCARYSWDRAAADTLDGIERIAAREPAGDRDRELQRARAPGELPGVAGRVAACVQLTRSSWSTTPRRTAASRRCPRPASRRPHLSRSPGTPGFRSANNAGIRATTSELILLLNNDTIVPAGRDRSPCRHGSTRSRTSPSPVRDWWMRTDEPELSFGRMISPLGELRQKTLDVLQRRGARLGTGWIARATPREQFVDWVSGACLLVRRPAAEDGGPARRAVFPLHRGRGLLRRGAGPRPSRAVHAGRRDRAPARPIAGDRTGGIERGLSPQPPRVLRETPSRAGRRSSGCICGSRAGGQGGPWTGRPALTRPTRNADQNTECPERSNFVNPERGFLARIRNEPRTQRCPSDARSNARNRRVL